MRAAFRLSQCSIVISLHRRARKKNSCGNASRALESTAKARGHVVGAHEGRGFDHDIAVDILAGLLGIEIDGDNTSIGERREFAGIALPVAIRIDPNLQIGEDRVIGVDLAVAIRVERPQIREGVAAERAEQFVRRDRRIVVDVAN